MKTTVEILRREIDQAEGRANATISQLAIRVTRLEDRDRYYQKMEAGLKKIFEALAERMDTIETESGNFRAAALTAANAANTEIPDLVREAITERLSPLMTTVTDLAISQRELGQAIYEYLNADIASRAKKEPSAIPQNLIDAIRSETHHPAASMPLSTYNLINDLHHFVDAESATKPVDPRSTNQKTGKP